ncbi:Chemotaxis response regulator protein-glutamate methylesterase of group 1 operon [Nymphon striatum]|nr:Chemotaxis response regulator protein-glutamate methylesterase of group 1 operon [Nymphon striatum]
MILIGSSTGGVEALRSVLVGFPPNCPPTMIVQHTGKNFGQGLVSLLDRICPAKVVPVEDNRPVEAGHVYVAAGQPRHFGLTSRRPLRTLKEGPPISGHTPSVDALFTSAIPVAKDVVASHSHGNGARRCQGAVRAAQGRPSLIHCTARIRAVLPFYICHHIPGKNLRRHFDQPSFAVKLGKCSRVIGVLMVYRAWIFLTTTCLMLACGALSAMAASDRVALVFGMSSYTELPSLDNTANDAIGMAETLETIGFDVTLAVDANGAEVNQLLDDFAFRSEVADLALIYFAGHGIEVQGENFLIPVDAQVNSNRDVQRQSVSLKQMLAAVESARKMRIVILDSCRDNPLGDAIDTVQPQMSTQTTTQSARSGGSGGLAAADPDRGTLVAFAAKDGQVALDGTGKNSPFAMALMDKMTRNLQEPHTYGSLTGIPFYLAGAAEGQPELSAKATEAWSAIKPDQEEQLLALADLGDTRSMLGLAYIRLNPNEGRFDPTAAVDFLQRAADAGSPEAQFELAKLYERGTGVEPDDAKALALYRAAAAQNFADAINDLGFLHYQGGLGLPADPQKALRFFERAADLRHPQAQFNFAALIDDGLISTKGPDDAALYLYAALRSGSADVLNLLSERPTMFTPETRRALQVKLRQKSFYAGAIDGDFGPGTQRGIRRAYGIED